MFTEQREISSPAPALSFMKEREVLIYYGYSSQEASMYRNALLSKEEMTRMNRFRREADRNRFAESRVQLRNILGAHLDTAPSSLRFTYNKHGKPSLEGDTGLHFNLTHTGNLWAIAVATKNTGLDVEPIDRPVRADKLRDLLFTKKEKETFQELPLTDQKEFFLHYWTMKEALLKGLGSGLSFPMNRIQLTGDSAILFNENGVAYGTIPWKLNKFRLEHNFICALAIEEKECDATAPFTVRFVPVSNKTMPA